MEDQKEICPVKLNDVVSINGGKQIIVEEIEPGWDYGKEGYPSLWFVSGRILKKDGWAGKRIGRCSYPRQSA